MKRLLTIFVLAFGSTLAIAQQDPQFSQYMHNKLFINPAYAGMKKAFCISALYRNQWNGFEGAPNTGTFSADLALPRNGGVGLNVMYDKLGFENNVSFRGSYSFHIPMPTKEGRLGIGIELGGYSKRIGPTGTQHWLATSDWTSDPTVPTLLKKTVLDMGFGLWYQDKNVWFGLSTSHLNAKAINYGTAVTNNTIQSLFYQVTRHYYITGGVNLHRSVDWVIKPSFLVKTDAVITSFDLNATAAFKNRFWFGASYRFQDAVCPMAGIMIPMSDENENLGLKIGFAYDYNISNLKQYNNGSFEVFINYCMPVDWSKGIHFDVRLFK
ncbi:MAG: type IX secretion system membrane protein PorP/SprF [Bacteroidia bacterium]